MSEQYTIITQPNKLSVVWIRNKIHTDDWRQIITLYFVIKYTILNYKSKGSLSILNRLLSLLILIRPHRTVCKYYIEIKFAYCRN